MTSARYDRLTMNRRNIVAIVALMTASSAFAQTPPATGDKPANQVGPAAGQVAQRLMQSDKDGDGKLSADELPPGLREQIGVLDTNKDGFLEVAEIAVLARGQAEGRRPQGARGGQPQNFESAMKRIERSFEGLEESAFDAASKAQDLERVQAVQAGLIAAKGLIATVGVPPSLKGKYGDDASQFHANMRDKLIQTIVASVDLEKAIIAGDSAAAKASMKRMELLEHESHDAFQEPESEKEKDAGKDKDASSKAKPLPDPTAGSTKP